MALFPFAASGEEPKSLVENGGFEQGSTGWSLFVPAESKEKNCRFSISSDAPHSGGHCMKMEADNYARFAVGLGNFSAQPGERYRVSAWVRGNAESQPGTAGFVIRLTLRKDGKDAQGGHLFIGMDGRVTRNEAPESAPAFPAQWTKVEAVVEIPGGVDAFGPGLFFWSAKGSVYLDDIAVVKVDAATPLTPAAVAGQAMEGPAVSESQALSALNLDAPGMEAVKAAAQSGSLEAAKQAYLDYRRSACPAKFKLMPSDKPAKAEAQTDEVGDEILSHVIKDRNYRFYTEPVDMGKEFDWTRNPLAPTDPAYTQEWTWCVISRMHFLENISKAYWKTLDEKYANEGVALLVDFIRKNNRFKKLAPGEPSLWRTLDASGRMTGMWPAAYNRFLGSPAFTPEVQWLYLRSILDHANLLKKGLETPGRNGNWVASECFGLFTIGVLFPELKDAKAWRDFALTRLVEEANCTVPADGYEAELTPNYHYFALSSLTGPMKLARLNQLEVPEIFRTKVLAMYQAPVVVMDQSGSVVATNDSPVYNAAKQAKEGLQLLGDNDPLLSWAASGGKEGKPLPTSTMLPYAGFYAMRGGWQPNDAFLFFRAGPTGTAHQHEDMLEVVLKAWNKTLLMEPGSYTYDHSNWRRYAIGTASHNTVIVDGKWQHRGANKPPVTEAVKNPWYATPLFDYVSGCYNGGYQENVYNSAAQYSPEKWIGEKDFSVSHTRRVLFLKPYYALLLDTLDGTGSHQYDAHFHMDAPSAKLDPATLVAVSQNPQDEAQVALYPLDKAGLSAEIVQGQNEPILGWYPAQHRAIPTVRFRKTQEAPAVFATFLYPFKGEAPKVETQPLPLNGQTFWASSLKTPLESSEIMVAKDNAPHALKLKSNFVGTFKAEAAGLVIRRPAQSSDATYLGAWGFKSFGSKTWQFSLSEPGAIAWVFQGGNLVVQNAGSSEVRLKIAEPFAREAALAPGAWMEISKAGAKEAASPLEVLKPLDDITASSAK